MKKRAFSSPTNDQTTISRKKASTQRPNETQEAWKHYFDDGLQAFKASQYKEALQYFSHALTLQPTNLTLLDSRSTTYDRLQQWDAAVKDAKLMIKVAPTVAKGYLRLGKLVASQQLPQQKQYTQAAMVYRRGCAKVDQDDARYSLLVSLASDMEDKVKTSARRIQGQRDPLAILPYDVLDLVFSYLPFHRRVACTQVSRTWLKFLQQWPGMWRNLDFITGAMKHDAVSKKTLANYFSYTHGRHIRRFSLSASKTKTDYALQLLIDQDCQYLEYLGFSHSTFSLNLFSRTLRLMGKHLTHLYLDNCDLPFVSIFGQLTTICPELTHFYYGSDIKTDFTSATLQPLPKLQQLHLVTNTTQVALDLILPQCPNLTHLILPRINVSVDDLLEQHPLPHLCVYYHDACAIMTKQTHWWDPPSVIQKTGWTAFTAMGTTLNDATLNKIVETHQTTLEILNLRQSVGFTNTWCTRLRPDARLVELNLDQCTSMTDADLCQVITSCPHLQVVHFAYIQAVTNTTLDYLSQLPALQHLDVSACLHITGSGLRRLVDRCQHSLKRLVMNHCTAIQPDAVQHARTVLGRTAVECTFGR